MDRHTLAIYKRGATIVLPVLAIVGGRIGLRACLAVHDADRHRQVDNTLVVSKAEADRAVELAAAQAASEAAQRDRARRLPTAAPGTKTVPIASGQQVPDALAVDAHYVAWLATRSGDVVVAARSSGTTGAPKIVAKNQQLPDRRHVQGLALGGGYVYWITTGSKDTLTHGFIMRASLADVMRDGDTDGGKREAISGPIDGLTAIALDKGTVYYARTLDERRDEAGEPSGGVYRLEIAAKGGTASKPDRLVVAAEAPCAIAVDDTAVYAVEEQKLWRAAKKGSAPKAIVSGAERLACTVAVDPENVYWTIPADDSVMRAKKADGSGVGVVAFTRKRPTNIAVDQGYAYVLTESSPQALGELGSIFKVALRSDRLTPKALVTDQVGLGSVAALGGYVVFSGYNEAENDGTVVALPPADVAQ